MNLQTAHRNFFRQKHTSFPKLKSKKNSRKRYTTNNQLIGVIKSVKVEQTPTNKYFVSILVGYDSQVPEVELKKFIGLDYSMHDLYVTSEGERANYPRYFSRHKKKLVRLCRGHSRRKQGIRNRERMRLRVYLEYEKITNQRTDYLHKKSYCMAENYDAACIETLNMRAMS